MNEVTAKLRNRIVEVVYNSKEGHIASALSILDIIYTLYDKTLEVNPQNIDRDRFILSKGHGCLALYVVLENKQFFGREELDKYCQFDANLGGHPYPKLPGIECVAGSLGHGFPFAVGIALAMKKKQSKGKVVVLVGDQECNEGTIWEALLLAAQHKLNNLTLIVDNNNSSSRSLRMDNFPDKFKSFGWGCITINGHNSDEIDSAVKLSHEVPMAIIANTVKGCGYDLIEKNSNEWHHKIPTEAEYRQLVSL